MEYHCKRVESSNVFAVFEFDLRWDMICTRISEIENALYRHTLKDNPAIRLFVLTGGEGQFGVQR